MEHASVASLKATRLIYLSLKRSDGRNNVIFPGGPIAATVERLSYYENKVVLYMVYISYSSLSFYVTV